MLEFMIYEYIHKTLERNTINTPFYGYCLYHSLRVFENRVMKIFGPKRDEVIGGWRKLHNEELHNLYCSPSIIRMVKSRTMRWAEHVA
jgi:hypothetical protein